MGEALVELKPEKYYEEAKLMIEKKDLLGFVSKISIAMEIAKKDKQMLARAAYLNIEGLMNFKQYKKVLEYIDDALNLNDGKDLIPLKEYKGVAMGYLGYLNDAILIFKKLLNVADNPVDITRACLNLSWAYLTLSKDMDETKLDEVKVFIDKMCEYFDEMPNNIKRKICNNQGVYYYYKKEYDKAVKLFNQSFEYSEEKDYAKIYNNLAEIYLNLDEPSTPVKIKEYIDQAEIYATRFNDKLELGKAFYTKAMIELRENQLFSAMDYLYISFDYFKDVEALAYAFKCLMKINEVVTNYKNECMQRLYNRLKMDLKGTPFEI